MRNCFFLTYRFASGTFNKSPLASFFHNPLIQGQFINDKIIHVYGSENGIFFWGGGANKKEHHEITCTFIENYIL